VRYDSAASVGAGMTVEAEGVEGGKTGIISNFFEN